MRFKIVLAIVLSLFALFIYQFVSGNQIVEISGINNSLLPFVILFALVAEYIDSSLGMGYGTTLTPLLVLMGFDAKMVVPAILFSELCTGLSAATFHHIDGNVNFFTDKEARKTAFLLSILSVVGSVVAVFVAIKLSAFFLSLVIGLIILAAGVVILLTVNKKLKFRNSHIIALGTIAAFNKGVSGGGYGPIVTAGQVVSGVGAKSAVSITSLAESFVCLTGLLCYYFFGKDINWGFAVALASGALLSVPLSTFTVKKMAENRLKLIIGIVTCVLGLLMLAKVWLSLSVQI